MVPHAWLPESGDMEEMPYPIYSVQAVWARNKSLLWEATKI